MDSAARARRLRRSGAGSAHPDRAGRASRRRCRRARASRREDRRGGSAARDRSPRSPARRRRSCPPAVRRGLRQPNRWRDRPAPAGAAPPARGCEPAGASARGRPVPPAGAHRSPDSPLPSISARLMSRIRSSSPSMVVGCSSGIVAATLSRARFMPSTSTPAVTSSAAVTSIASRKRTDRTDAPRRRSGDQLTRRPPRGDSPPPRPSRWAARSQPRQACGAGC